MAHQPTIQVNLAISPNPITLGDKDCTLTITATLDYLHPITIYTYQSIFALDLAQTRWDFSCIDLSDNDKPVDMQVENVQRTPCFSLQFGSYDDQFLVTFHPGIPVTITGEFALATRTFHETLKPGHRYRFGVTPKYGNPRIWLHGTREDVMTTEPKRSREHERKLIEFEPCGDVEFEVVGDTALSAPREE